MPGDARCPADILASPDLTGVIDTASPFCLILAMILNFIEPAQCAAFMTVFGDCLPAGSYLVVSLGFNDVDPDVAQDWIAAYRAAAQVHEHSQAQVEGYFAGLEIVEPGLVEARNWRPAHPPSSGIPGPRW